MLTRPLFRATRQGHLVCRMQKPGYPNCGDSALGAPVFEYLQGCTRVSSVCLPAPDRQRRETRTRGPVELAAGDLCFG